MNYKLKLTVMLVLGIVGFIIWSVMAYFDGAMRADYAKFVISIVVGIVALAMRDMQPPAPPAAVVTPIAPFALASAPAPTPTPPAAG